MLNSPSWGGHGMNVIPTAISGVLIIEPKVFGDQRGFFLETFKADRTRRRGLSGPFVQDNLSRSAHGVLRGLHLQNPRTQGKLVTVLRGLCWTLRSMSASAARPSGGMLPSN